MQWPAGDLARGGGGGGGGSGGGGGGEAGAEAEGESEPEPAGLAGLAGHHLMLRSWLEINRAFEFRCFVFQRKLIAVSQRRCDQRFDFLREPATAAGVRG